MILKLLENTQCEPREKASGSISPACTECERCQITKAKHGQNISKVAKSQHRGCGSGLSCGRRENSRPVERQSSNLVPIERNEMFAQLLDQLQPGLVPEARRQLNPPPAMQRVDQEQRLRRLMLLASDVDYRTVQGRVVKAALAAFCGRELDAKACRELARDWVENDWLAHRGMLAGHVQRQPAAARARLGVAARPQDAGELRTMQRALTVDYRTKEGRAMKAVLSVRAGRQMLADECREYAKQWLNARG